MLCMCYQKNNLSKAGDNSLGSQDEQYKVSPHDELARYLAMDLDESKVSSNPFKF